jgi:hypothetical protein
MLVSFAALSVSVVGAPAYAQGDPSKSGDLTGNFSGVVWLLIPLAIGLALLTAYALGSRGAPDPSEHRLGGVSRALSRRESAGDASS